MPGAASEGARRLDRGVVPRRVDVLPAVQRRGGVAPVGLVPGQTVLHHLHAEPGGGAQMRLRVAHAPVAFGDDGREPAHARRLVRPGGRGDEPVGQGDNHGHPPGVVLAEQLVGDLGQHVGAVDQVECGAQHRRRCPVREQPDRPVGGVEVRAVQPAAQAAAALGGRLPVPDRGVVGEDGAAPLQGRGGGELLEGRPRVGERGSVARQRCRWPCCLSSRQEACSSSVGRRVSTAAPARVGACTTRPGATGRSSTSGPGSETAHQAAAISSTSPGSSPRCAEIRSCSSATVITPWRRTRSA
jgi:hypothetical protein